MNLRNISAFGARLTKRRNLLISATATIAVASLAVFIYNTVASGPFTVSPNVGSIHGGDEITIDVGNGGDFATSIYKWTADSYVAKSDLYIQLDAIQNKRNNPTSATSGAGTSISHNSVAWEDLACSSYGTGYGNTSCEDFIIRGNNARWQLDPDYNTPRLNLNGSSYPNYGSANGSAALRLSSNFNWSTLWTTTGPSITHTFEIGEKQNVAGSSLAVLYEFGTSNTTAHSWHQYRNASATNTFSSGNCYSDQRNATTGTVRAARRWPCANDTSWDTMATSFSRTGLSNSQYQYINGDPVSLASGNNTGQTFTPQNSANFYIGGRSKTNANNGSALFNGSIRTFRVYKRLLTAQELQCNYWIDQARYEGTENPNLNTATCLDLGAERTPEMSPAPIVTIGGEICEITSYTATQIKCKTPAGTAGRKDVTVVPDASTGLPSQTYYGGFEYRTDTFDYEIMNTGVDPYTYKVNPDSLRAILPYDHASLINISFPRTSSDGSTTVMTNSVTMANSTMRSVVGGDCGGVACTTVTVSITGNAANIEGENGLLEFIKGLEWSGNAGYLRGNIRITVLPENVEFWIDNDGNRHFYELVDSGDSNLTWSEAYNLASNRTFRGLKGYLVSMTEKAEADIILQYTQNSNLSAVGYTSGIRFRKDNTANTTSSDDLQTRYPKVDATIGYNGNPITEMPAMPSGTNSIASAGFACTSTSSNVSGQGCTSIVPAVNSSAIDACPSSNAYDTQWYWANPVDNGLEYYSGRIYSECSGNPLKTTDLTDYWNGDQPQGGEMIMAYSSSTGSFGWHDYSNNAGSYYYVEYSEGWFDSGTYDPGTTYWSAPIPLEITIHHVRANTGEQLAPDTKAPSMGLNTTTNQFQCNAANGGKSIDGYFWQSSSCTNGQFPYNLSSETQEITYIYSHNSVPNPVPFRMERTTASGKYVYKMHAADSGTAVDDFGTIRQIVITFPSDLQFSSALPSGWSTESITAGKVVLSVPQEHGVSATQVQDYLYTIALTAAGLNNVTGSVTVEVSDYPDTPASGDPGRASSTGALPQPITYHYYRLGQTTDLVPGSETIGLVNQSITLSEPPQYLPIGSNASNAEYKFYQSSPATGTLITYRGTPSTVYYYYQPANGHTVSFSMNGEYAIDPTPDQTVSNGDNAVRPPVDPIVPGKRFLGWYETSTCLSQFDFANTPITSNQTIYACFNLESSMTVVFDESSPSGTPEIPTNPTQIDNVTYNSTITAPSSPILPGYAFSSWNTEPMIDSTTCSGSPWDFASNRVSAPAGTSEITLYVCWEPRSNVTINFNATTNSPARVQVLPNPSSRSTSYNGTTIPPTSPVSEGYAFVNWHTEPMIDNATCGGAVFDFANTRLTSAATTAYACWEKRADLSITFSKGDKEGNPNILGWPVNVTDMPYNSAAATYQPEVTLEDWRLSHWCESTNPNCSRSERFDWSARRTSDMSLVAVWREDVMAIDEIVPNFGSTEGGYRITIYGSGFLSYDANSYAQNGLMVLLDGENNAGTLDSPSHNTSATTWNNLAPAATSAFGNFNLSGATINPSSLSFNGLSNSFAKSASSANLNGTIGGTSIAQVTTEVAYKQNATGSSYSQLYEYGPFGYANSNYLNTFGEVINADDASSSSAGNCYIGQRTSTYVFTGGYGACANNTIPTTHTSIQSKSSGTPRRLIIDGNYSNPAVSADNTQTAFSATRNLVIAARTTNSSQSTFSNNANISVSSFRMYNRTLTDTEIRCNYLVDLARFQGIFDIGLSSCGSQLKPIVPDVIEINGEPCTNVQVSNENQLSCVVPASTLEGDANTPPYREGVVDTHIKVGEKETTLQDSFTYQAPLAIFSISPSSGINTGGETITITGTDFRDLAQTPAGAPEVLIGNNICTNVTLSSDFHSLTCTVPASTTDGPGPADVTVTIPNRSQSSTVIAGYYYYSNLSITNVTPNAGGLSGGTELTITGAGFGNTELTYSVVLDYDNNPSVCVITSKTDSAITCTTTAHVTSGTVDVMVSNGLSSATSIAAFTYMEEAVSYVNACYDEVSKDWLNGDTNYIFMDQGGTATCKLTLDAPFSGTISLADDYVTTISPLLSGSFDSTDSRFSNGTFTLDYTDEDISSPTSGQVLYYTYTAPTAHILEQYYDNTDTSAGYVGNGYDLYWPALIIGNSGNLVPSDDDIVVFGLTAEKYWIYPNGANTIYVVNSEGAFTISTHGAFFPGAIAFNDDLSYSDNPAGTPGIFGTDGQTPNNIVNLADLEGADSGFSYKPQTSATGLNYIRINGTSDPSIANTYYDIKATDSCLSITGPSSMSRGQTAEFTLVASCGENWSGEVTLSDPFNSSGEVGGAFTDTSSTSGNPSGTFNAGTRTFTFTAGSSETYRRTFNWTMRDDSITPPTFPSYIVYITADDGEGASYTPVLINASSLRFACASGYSNCTTAYVGNLFDIALYPNGMIIGRAQVTSDGGGSLGNNGLVSWSSSDPYVMSVTPNTPGRKTLAATILESNNPSMPANSTFLSTAANSLNDYIWVMADSTTLSGSTKITSGEPNTYTLTLNGPFDGTVLLSDVLQGTTTSAGGTFSKNQCTFNKATDYDLSTNTTNCTFTYTPASSSSNKNITLRANKQSTYNQALAPSSLNITAYSQAVITEVCKVGTGGDSGIPCDNSGSFDGGDEVIIYGNNFIPYTNPDPTITVTFDSIYEPAICTSATIIDNNRISCTTSAHSVWITDVTVDNGAEIITKTDAFIYRPVINTIIPNNGYISGGNSIAIFGGGFTTGEIEVAVGGNACTNLSVVNVTTLVCTAPASTLPGDRTGTVDIDLTVYEIAAPTFADSYTYELALAIDDVTPKIGVPTGGNKITITGVGFNGSTSVLVGDQQCTNVSVIDARHLTCTVPSSNLSGNGEGTVSVTVSDSTNPSHTKKDTYTYRELMSASVAAPNPVPTIGGTNFSVVGYNFIPPTSYTENTETTVTFISANDGTRLSCTDVVVSSNMLITCVTPEASVGTYNVEVNNGYETTILTGVLTYEPNPMIVTGVEPAQGLTTGGNTISITGSGFGENHITNPAYTQLEYLNFTGEQYINTGQNQTGSNVRVAVDFEYSASASNTTSYLFGARSSSTSDWFAFYRNGSTTYRNAYNTSTGSNLAISSTCPLGTRCQIDKNNGATFMTVGDTTTSLTPFTNASMTTPVNIYIGARNSNGTVSGTTSGFQGKIYSYKMWKGGADPVLDMIPACRNSDGVGGMYDLVSGTFFPSNRSGYGFDCTGIPTVEIEVAIGDNICTNATIVSDTEITCTVPASTISENDGAGTVDAYVSIGNQDNTLVAAYTYFNPATSYIHECRESPAEEWTVQPYIAQNTDIECRIVLDNPYEGDLDLSDDYEYTIDPGLGGTFGSSDPRFSWRKFSLTYADTLTEAGRTLYYTYTAPETDVLEAFYEEYTDPQDCDERCDNGFDLYWPLLSVENNSNLLNNSGDLVIGLLANAYYIIPNGQYDSYCVDCTVEFILSTHGAPYFGTIALKDDLSNSDNPTGASGIFSDTVLNLTELDGSDGSFEYTPKTPATNGNHIHVYGVSSNPAVTDSSFDLSPVYQSTLTITGPTALERGKTGTFTLTVVDAGVWSGTVTLSDVFGVGGTAGGTFVDTSTGTNPSGTFDPSTNTFTFTGGQGETYVRTFTYTVRDDHVSGTPFPGYNIRLIGDNGTSTGYSVISVLADELYIKCGNNYPNCTTAYVSESKDFSISSNGVLNGTGQATDHSGGQMTRGGAMSWSGAEPFVLSYSPVSSGHKTITTTISSETNTTMNGKSYNSTATDSLGNYIYVMASRMTVSGPSLLLSGATATYTLTLNGPFVGTINLSDIYSNGSLPANGTFSNTSCTFGLQNYIYTDNNESLGTGTTTCTFDYTPANVTTNQTVRINATVDGNYRHEMILTPANITVRTSMSVSSISPEAGPNDGGDTMTITGSNLNSVVSVTVGGETCTNLTIVTSSQVTCTIPAHNGLGIVDVVVTGSDGEVEILEDAFEYYIPLTITGITPAVGPAKGGTSVLISGTGFTTLGGKTKITVWFDDAECVIGDRDLDITNDSILCSTSEHEPGVVDILVDDSIETASFIASFTYTEPLTLDTICQAGTGPSVNNSPACRPYGLSTGGTEVVLTGNNFIRPDSDISQTTVTLDYSGDQTAAACTIISITNDTIHCTTSAHAPGLVDVYVDNGYDSAEITAEPGETDADLPDSGYVYTQTYVNLSNDNVSYAVDIATGENSGFTVAQVGTNNPTGYTLTLKSNDANLVCENDSSIVIPSITSDGSLANGQNSSWGYNVVTPSGSWTNGTPNTPSSWKKIPTSSPDLLYSRTNPALPDHEDEIGLFFGTRATVLTPACTYQQTLTLTVVANL